MLLMKRCFVLPVKMTRLCPNIQEEADICIVFIPDCLNIRISLPDASTASVTSKVTRHRCLSTACTISQGYNLNVLFNTDVETKATPSECQQHRSEYGKEICSKTLFYRL